MEYSIEDYGTFTEAIQDLTYLAFIEEASTEDLLEAFKEAIDEFFPLDPFEDEDVTDIYEEPGVDPEIQKLAKKFWDDHLATEIEAYIANEWDDELANIQDLTFEEFERAVISHMTLGLENYQIAKELEARYDDFDSEGVNKIFRELGNITREVIEEQMDSVQ